MLIRVFLTLLCCLLTSPAWAFPENGVLVNFTGCVDTTTPPTSALTNAVIVGASSSTVDCEDLAATNTTTGVEGDAYYNVATFNANSETYATIVATGSGLHGSVSVRLANIGGNTTDGYLVYWSENNDVLDIYRIDNGALTLLGTGVAQDPANGDSFGIRAVGSQICSWYKVGAGAWTERECVTDATYSAGGRIGFTVSGGTAIGQVDDFGGGNVASTRRHIPPIFFQ